MLENASTPLGVLQKLRQLAMAILTCCSRLMQTIYCALLNISPPSFWTNTHATLNFTNTFLSLSRQCITHLNMLVYMSNVFKSSPLSEIPFSVPTSFAELVTIQPITLSHLMRSQKTSELTVDCGEEQLLGYVQSNTIHLYIRGGSLWLQHWCWERV